MPPRHSPPAALLLAVALGGAVGASARFALTRAVPDPSNGFPWTIFAINVIGAGLLALLPAAPVVRRHALLPPLLGAGVLGGFTTLSAASEESRALVDGGHTTLAATYVVATLAAALAAVAVADRLSTVAQRTATGDGEGEQ